MMSQPAGVDSTNVEERRVVPLRLALVGGVAGALVTAAHVQNYNSWWKGERSAFQFGDGAGYVLGADKLGHFYFTYLSSDMIGRSFAWAGLRESDAFLYGGAISFAFQLYVEVEDGFTHGLGFSVGDGLADIAGAAYPWLKQQSPALEHFDFKWNFIRSEKFKQGQLRAVIDDYESQYFWISANVKELLPDIVPDFWPSFLPVAIGYSVKNLDGSSGGEREFYLALDYDFTKLPGKGSFLSALKHVLNYFHFPAPTIRLTPSIITYGLRY
jgi:hypothetical protein